MPALDSPDLRPAPFWSPTRWVLAVGAFLLPAATLALGSAACGNQEGGVVQGLGGGGNEPTTATGVGGNDADATVPDAQPDVVVPTLAELCGEGPCTPGLPDDCTGNTQPRGGFSTVGCQVVVGEDDEPASVCGPAGDGTSDAPCQGAEDCRPGFACIPSEGSNEEAPAGTCRQYCCEDLESCPPDAFCAARPLVDDLVLQVPVCVAQTPCELLEAGSCPLGTACSVVRESGATSCIVPGKGTLCEPCDCAEGFVCAVHIGRCQRLCRTDGAGQECGTGFCQGGSDGYPTGFGVCVGGDHACK